MSLLPDSVNWDLALEKNKETKTTEPERPKSFSSQLFNSSKKTKVPWFAMGMALSDARETSLLKNNAHPAWLAEFRECDKKEYDCIINSELYSTTGPLKMGEVVHKVSEATENKEIGRASCRERV